MVEWSESNAAYWTIEMSQQWYEVWADESLATLYILLVVPDERMAGGVIVLDPKEGLKVVHAALSYENAKD